MAKLTMKERMRKDAGLEPKPKKTPKKPIEKNDKQKTTEDSK